MPELGYAPTNRYLPPRKTTIPTKPLERQDAGGGNALLRLLDKVLSR
jgi:sulfite dehydrogenase (quinone) subunit SoeB